MKEPRFSRRSESGTDRGEGPSEQQRWEEQQITKGVVKYGSKGREGSKRKGSVATEETEYELLMEDKIDFVLSDLNPGNLGENKKEVSILLNWIYILCCLIETRLFQAKCLYQLASGDVSQFGTITLLCCNRSLL